MHKAFDSRSTGHELIEGPPQVDHVIGHDHRRTEKSFCGSMSAERPHLRH
jgi:hypothetical protein